MDYSAKLVSKTTIELFMRKGFWPNGKDPYLRLYEEGKPVLPLKFLSTADRGEFYLYIIPVDYKFVPGKRYEIFDLLNNIIPLDISSLADEPDFDEKYRYDGQLGAIYSESSTTFRVFAPFSNFMFVHFSLPNDPTVYSVPMKRLDCGVYEATVQGNLDSARYRYAGSNDGNFFLSPDPYSYGLSSNSRYSYVINPQKILSRTLNRDCLKPLDPSKMTIYEADVRDMTSLTELQNKGTYLALSKEGLKDEDGFPIGLDYVLSLGFSHIQLLPVLDFQTIDDDDPFKTYNWGYDPLNYFSPEGSYSTDPDDPYKRLIELRDLVSAFHRHGMRVTFDVVYNHVFNAKTNPLGVLVPGYYFRKNKDGSPSNGSFCGNDLESRHYMCRRLIKDSLAHAVDFFGADGFRFDLMGIIDNETLKEAYEELKKDHPDMVFYGEGWDMPTNLPYDQKSIDGNGMNLPFLGFFNGFFRDVVKGNVGGGLGIPGYLCGDLGKIEDFKFAFGGSVMEIGRRPMFVKTCQSINFVECHDNETLFDKLQVCRGDDSEDERFKRINLINATVIFAQGVPFIHMGQEYGATKEGMGNTYNAGDELNGLNYEVASNRKDMIRFLREALDFRKTLPIFYKDRGELIKHMSFENIGHGALKVTYSLDRGESYHIIINPSKDTFNYNFDSYVKVVFNEKGKVNTGYDLYSQLLIIPSLSFTICYQQPRDD